MEKTGVTPETLVGTKYSLEGETAFYKGKVRDVYTLHDKYVLMIATDRISAFDVVLPRGIPYKGQILSSIAIKFMKETADIVPNWVIASPDPMATFGLKCDPIRIEMVIRGYLTGHAWREYSSGKRLLCGVTMPDGMKENDAFPEPIITPATKAEEGHDEDISREEILNRGIISESDYLQLESYTRALYKRGTEIAAQKGLILVDTKYEFGYNEEKIYLIDEIHTPDSSRYFYKEGYEERQASGEQQKQLSKEFVRQWLIQNGFQGKDGQQVPNMSDEWINTISDRYIELYDKITGDKFVKTDTSGIEKRVLNNIESFLAGFFEKQN